ncbi:hypothetical protein ACO1O0_002834 [Amphichorda felina]
MHDYHKFISWPKLPKTFQDSVILCRKLGLEYIWIDSLCIIQDSARDWEDQSINMGNIYGHSYITIAAATSTGSSGGYFSKSLPDSYFSVNKPDEPGILIRVYQERMLSRRTLYYSRLEFQVGCRSGLLYEYGSSPVAPHFSIYLSPFKIARLREAPAQLQQEGTAGPAGSKFEMPAYHR